MSQVILRNEDSLWMGKRLGDMTREELIAALVASNNARLRDMAEHSRELDVMGGGSKNLRPADDPIWNRRER